MQLCNLKYKGAITLVKERLSKEWNYVIKKQQNIFLIVKYLLVQN